MSFVFEMWNSETFIDPSLPANLRKISLYAFMKGINRGEYNKKTNIVINIWQTLSNRCCHLETKKKYRKKELTTKTCLPRSPMITWTGIKQSETGEHKKQSQKVFRTQELAAYVAEAPGHLLTQDCQKLPFTEGWNTFLAPRPTSIQLKWST